MTNDIHLTEDLRVKELKKLVTPAKLKEELPLGIELTNKVLADRETVRDIIHLRDDRMLVVIGPCSIHDPSAALDYAQRLAKVADQVKDRYFIVMRVYFEKPRTTIGWKGFINDPHLDDSCDMEFGLHAARKLLLDIAMLGLPIATEFLDPIVPQYTADLVSWSAIGARTTESQTHREMSSGLSMPVGFKNATDGNIEIAINAIESASNAHSFLGIDQDGHTAIVKTTGNPNTHLVLRGGKQPNYQFPEVTYAACKLEAAGLEKTLMVDCSHANASKVARNQVKVWESILEQRAKGNCPITGAMVESFIEEGNQKISGNLTYGQSITDPCIDWATTEKMLRM
ncbi:Phospho-2-dehydro-3-deoxyheptonate aldolase, Tyr-sensitive [Pontiella desulfatans]|uniref:Phospho-2-dehydro-3-deoxyheptonate aldolase n=1 Tax=Pontiella desulfatans TaxID=2750659 RepID=A0A6C2TZL4_PONDE|nr:3-deoxy-7-phosphoheptulonate synthase [Pontiella desulfatans]VGO12904.1 Phospho-2-dehydro-3-deoxyheptonate aldolase, Tyr-sensitive [Pontiella desulfatans]